MENKTLNDLELEFRSDQWMEREKQNLFIK
jgi:hypothetical protein